MATGCIDAGGDEGRVGAHRGHRSRPVRGARRLCCSWRRVRYASGSRREHSGGAGFSTLRVRHDGRGTIELYRRRSSRGTGCASSSNRPAATRRRLSCAGCIPKLAELTQPMLATVRQVQHMCGVKVAPPRGIRGSRSFDGTRLRHTRGPRAVRRITNAPRRDSRCASQRR